mmetsp:Transcript_2389/g.6036  ORF Transcript_2389/g.6036 Transcript_2389/m.6036 type:complete len:204 (+) Transcript_2389:83-694(+)
MGHRGSEGTPSQGHRQHSGAAPGLLRHFHGDGALPAQEQATPSLRVNRPPPPRPSGTRQGLGKGSQHQRRHLAHPKQLRIHHARDPVPPDKGPPRPPLPPRPAGVPRGGGEGASPRMREGGRYRDPVPRLRLGDRIRRPFPGGVRRVKHRYRAGAPRRFLPLHRGRGEPLQGVCLNPRRQGQSGQQGCLQTQAQRGHVRGGSL